MGYFLADETTEALRVEPSVCQVTRVNLAIEPSPVSWETENADAIARHWVHAVAEKPSLFNGQIYVATDVKFAGDAFSGRAHPMRFAALTLWRHLGMPPVGFHSIFGDIILRGSDGGLIMARTSAHTATGGMLGFPGGTFDDNDVKDGALNPLTCILRECEEETGWRPDELTLDSRYLVYADQSRIAFTLVADMGVSATVGAERIRQTLRDQDQPELAAIFVAQGPSDLDRIGPHPYSHLLANWIFSHA